MRNIFLLVLGMFVFSSSIFAQKEIEGKIFGTMKDLIVNQRHDSTTNIINYQYFSDEGVLYKQNVNKLVRDYVAGVLSGTDYVVNPDLHFPQIFEATLKDFKQAYFDQIADLQNDKNNSEVNDSDDYFPPPYELNMTISLDTKTLKNYVQFNGETELYMGGAHGMYYNKLALFDKNSGKELQWNDILKDSVAMAAVAEKYFKKEEHISKRDKIYTSSTENQIPEGKNKPIYFFQSGHFELAQNFYLKKNKLVMVYQPYEAREWARGFIIVNIPKSKIKKYLKINW